MLKLSLKNFLYLKVFLPKEKHFKKLKSTLVIFESKTCTKKKCNFGT